MKKIYTLFILLSQWLPSFSQRCDWVDYAAGSLSSQSNAVATDASGNIFSLNIFTGNIIIQGDTIQAQYGNTDCILVKYDSSGNYLWAKVFGSASFDDIYKVAVDASGHVYASCFTQVNTMMTDTSYTNSGGDYQVIQFDNDGNFLRVKFISGLGVTALAALGNYVYAAYLGTLEKLDTNMNTLWSRTASPAGLSFYSKGDLYVSSNGHLVASGVESSGGTVSFDTISINFSGGGFNEVFLISMDTSGSAYWGRALYPASPEQETTFGAAGDNAGNVYMTLQTSAQMIFANDTMVNPLGNPNNNYLAVLRYDNSGNEVWGRAFYSQAGSDFYDVMVNSQNEILLAGDYTNGSAVFQQLNFPASGGAFVIKMDMNGTAIWKKHDLINSAFTKHFKGLTQLSSGKYAGVGFFPNNFKLDCFDAGASNVGFFTTVISENAVIDAVFAVNAVDPFTFNFTDQSLGTVVSWSWTFPGGTPSTSALQNPTVTFSTPGSYTATLVVCDGICCDSDSVMILNVGISELNADGVNLAIYPNPVNSEFGVWNSETITEVRILDMLGNEIYRKQNLSNSNFKLQVSNLAPGIYFLKTVLVDGKTLLRKFVKR